jgi:WD40 repeat protein
MSLYLGLSILLNLNVFSDGSAKIWKENTFDQIYQFQFSDSCDSLIINHDENICAGLFNHTYLRFFDLNSFKNLGKVFIHQNEVNCMGFIFKNQGLILTTLQDNVYVLDVQNWDPLSVLFTEIDKTFMPRNQFFSNINTKHITDNLSLCLFSFSDGTVCVLEVEKIDNRITSKVIDKFCMFEYQIAKSEDADIVELYQNLTKYRVKS